MNTEQKLEQAAEEKYPKGVNLELSGIQSFRRDAFIEGAKSEASKEYWQKTI